MYELTWISNSYVRSVSLSGCDRHQELNRQLVAAFEAAAFEYVATAFGTHPGTKAMYTHTASLFGLPCTFWHTNLLKKNNISPNVGGGKIQGNTADYYTRFTEKLQMHPGARFCASNRMYFNFGGT